MDDRVPGQPAERALRPTWMAPARAGHPVPPVVVVPQVHALRGLLEHDGAGHQHLRLCARVVLRARRLLGEGDVASRLDEAPELPVRHRVAVHPEPVHRDLVGGRLLRVVMVRSHQERAAGDPDHVLLGGSPGGDDATPASARLLIDALSQLGRGPCLRLRQSHPSVPRQEPAFRLWSGPPESRIGTLSSAHRAERDARRHPLDGPARQEVGHKREQEEMITASPGRTSGAR